MTRLGLVPWMLFVACVSTAGAVQSTFDTDLEGWTTDNVGALTHVATGGNPGGFLRLDNDETNIAHLFGPATFHGDLSGFDGMVLAVDGRLVAGGGSVYQAGDDYGVVRITGGGLSASADFQPGGQTAPLGAWASYVLPFDAGTFGVDQQAWNTILADVTELRITVEALFGAEVQGIDNVYLGPCTGGGSTSTSTTLATVTTATTATSSSTTQSTSSTTSTSTSTSTSSTVATTSSSTTTTLPATSTTTTLPATSTSTTLPTTGTSTTSSTAVTTSSSPTTAPPTSSTTTTSSTVATTSSSTPTTLPPDCERLDGKQLLLKSRTGRQKRGIGMLSLDHDLTLGAGNGSADDPVLHGGTLRLIATAGDQFDDNHPLAAGRWRYLKQAGRNRGYKLRPTAPFKTVTIVPGKRVKIVANGEGLGYTLLAQPEAVDVVLTIGAQCYCWRFGGEVTFTADKKLQAKNAPAPSACPTR